jgi:hypothetical protein
MRHHHHVAAGLALLAACGSGGGGGYYRFNAGDGEMPPAVDGGASADLARAPSSDLAQPSQDLARPAQDLTPVVSCNDGLRNGAETDVDCGGPQCSRCAIGDRCTGNGDCQSGFCDAGECATRPPAPTCNDLTKNGAETDVDCGGGTCPKCRDYDACQINADCQSGLCKLGECKPAATCNDLVKNGAETDVDCGGGTCPRCAVGQRCTVGSDCTGGQCAGGLCAGGGGQSHGPKHTFAGLTSDHYITQGFCSLNDKHDDVADADYFCRHFYAPNCTAKAGYYQATLPSPTAPKMHKNGGCTNQGLDVPGKTCESGPCKIGNWSETTRGLTNLICLCP